MDLLEFRFPLDFDRDSDLVSTEVKHSSAVHFSEHVTTYINKELSHGLMLDPFVNKPIQLYISPFMTREKQDSDLRRTIAYLSLLKGYSVNTGVSKDVYLGSKLSVDDIVQRLIQLGPGPI